MQGDGAQQSPGHGACHHTHAETSAHEPEVASPIFPIGDVGDIGASNRTCGAGDAGHDASGVEDLLMFDSLSSMHNVPVKWTKQGFCKPYATPSSRQLSDSLPIMTT